PARPVRCARERVARGSAAGDGPGARVRLTRALSDPGEMPGVEGKTGAHPVVPADAIDVDGVDLRRVYRQVEGEALVLADTGCRRVALDLSGRIVRDEAELPAARTGLLVLDHDRVVGSKCDVRH